MSSTQVILSTSNTNQYYVTVDSNYRDESKYPLSTDFGVSFETKDPTLNYPQGVPVDKTQMFPRFTIDRNFNSFDFTCKGGYITSCKVDSVGNFIIAGVIQPNEINGGGDDFFFTYNNTVLFQLVGIIYFSAPFIVQVSSSYQPVWLLTMTQQLPTTSVNITTYCSIDLNNDNSIMCMFDYSDAGGDIYTGGASFTRYYYTNNTLSSNVLSSFRFITPYQDNALDAVAPFTTASNNFKIPKCSTIGVFAFSNNGDIYQLNGNPWGYHSFYSAYSLINALPSSTQGLNSLVTDSGNSTYNNVHLNPYELPISSNSFANSVKIKGSTGKPLAFNWYHVKQAGQNVGTIGYEYITYIANDNKLHFVEVGNSDLNYLAETSDIYNIAAKNYKEQLYAEPLTQPRVAAFAVGPISNITKQEQKYVFVNSGAAALNVYSLVNESSQVGINLTDSYVFMDGYHPASNVILDITAFGTTSPGSVQEYTGPMNLYYNNYYGQPYVAVALQYTEKSRTSPYFSINFLNSKLVIFLVQSDGTLQRLNDTGSHELTLTAYNSASVLSPSQYTFLNQNDYVLSPENILLSNNFQINFFLNTDSVNTGDVVFNGLYYPCTMSNWYIGVAQNNTSTWIVNGLDPTFGTPTTNASSLWTIQSVYDQYLRQQRILFIIDTIFQPLGINVDSITQPKNGWKFLGKYVVKTPCVFGSSFNYTSGTGPTFLNLQPSTGANVTSPSSYNLTNATQYVQSMETIGIDYDSQLDFFVQIQPITSADDYVFSGLYFATGNYYVGIGQKGSQTFIVDGTDPSIGAGVPSASSLWSIKAVDDAGTRYLQILQDSSPYAIIVIDISFLPSSTDWYYLSTYITSQPVLVTSFESLVNAHIYQATPYQGATNVFNLCMYPVWSTTTSNTIESFGISMTQINKIFTTYFLISPDIFYYSDDITMDSSFVTDLTVQCRNFSYYETVSWVQNVYVSLVCANSSKTYMYAGGNIISVFGANVYQFWTQTPYATVYNDASFNLMYTKRIEAPASPFPNAPSTWYYRDYLIGSSYSLGSYNIYNVSDPNSLDLKVATPVQVGASFSVGLNGCLFLIKSTALSAWAITPNVLSGINETVNIYTFFNPIDSINTTTWNVSYGSMFDDTVLLSTHNNEVSKYYVNMAAVSGNVSQIIAAQSCVVADDGTIYSVLAQTDPNSNGLCSISTVSSNLTFSAVGRFAINLTQTVINPGYTPFVDSFVTCTQNNIILVASLQNTHYPAGSILATGSLDLHVTTQYVPRITTDVANLYFFNIATQSIATQSTLTASKLFFYKYNNINYLLVYNYTPSLVSMTYKVYTIDFNTFTLTQVGSFTSIKLYASQIVSFFDMDCMVGITCHPTLGIGLIFMNLLTGSTIYAQYFTTQLVIPSSIATEMSTSVLTATVDTYTATTSIAFYSISNSCKIINLDTNILSSLNVNTVHLSISTLPMMDTLRCGAQSLVSYFNANEKKSYVVLLKNELVTVTITSAPFLMPTNTQLIYDFSTTTVNLVGALPVNETNFYKYQTRSQAQYFQISPNSTPPTSPFILLSYQNRVFMITCYGQYSRALTQFYYGTPSVLATYFVQVVNTVFIFDITSPTFAVQNLIFNKSNQYYSIFGKGTLSVVSLNNLGSTKWTTSVGDTTAIQPYLDSQYVTSNNSVLTADQLSLGCGVNFVAKGAVLNKGAGCTNTFKNYTTSSGLLLNLNVSEGNPFIYSTFQGQLETILSDIVSSASSFLISLTNFSTTTFCFQSSQASSFINTITNPTIITKVLNNPGKSSVAIVAVTSDKNGTYQWAAQVQPQGFYNVTSTNLLNVGNNLYLLGYADQVNVNIYDGTSTSIAQTIYPFSVASNRNYVYLIKFTSDVGKYAESDSIETPDNVVLANQNSDLYYNPFTSNVHMFYDENILQTYASMLARNKDGTIGEINTIARSNLNQSKYKLTIPGIYQLDIPTGTTNILIKLWGAGGSASTGPNGYIYGRGGGGGFSIASLNVNAGDRFYFKIGNSNEGGRSTNALANSTKGGYGGGMSYCLKQSGTQYQLISVSAGGGGAGVSSTGAGYNAFPYLTDGGPAGLDAGSFNYESYYFSPGASAGSNGQGGFAGLITNPSTGSQYGTSSKGSNYPFFVSTITGTFGYGGTYVYTGSDVNWVYSAGGGGQGFGGGGGGSQTQGSTFGPFATYAGGGGGGGMYGKLVQNGGFISDVQQDNLFPIHNKYLIPDIAAGITDPDYPGNFIGYGGTGTRGVNGNPGYGVIYFTNYTTGSASTTGATPYISQGCSYKLDSRYLESSTNSYFSRLNVYKDSSNILDLFAPYQTGTNYNLTNYYAFLKGYIGDTVLNQNFSIRSNLFSSNNYYVILNSIIDSTKLIRKFEFINNAYPTLYNYVGNISSSTISSIVKYNLPAVNNQLTVTNNYGASINSDNCKYLLIGPIAHELVLTNVSSTTLTYTGALNNYGPYAYLTAFNKSALYNLQFYPATIYSKVVYTIQLQQLILPNRRIRNAFIKGGYRDITDFAYIFLEIFIVDNQGQEPTTPINNIYSNNPNRQPQALFTIPVVSGSTSNYTTYSSSDTPIITFYPGFYNIRFRLKDPNGNIIIFDNTPYKSTDTVFGTGVVSPSLMNTTFKIIFKKF